MSKSDFEGGDSTNSPILDFVSSAYDALLEEQISETLHHVDNSIMTNINSDVISSTPDNSLTIANKAIAIWQTATNDGTLLRERIAHDICGFSNNSFNNLNCNQVSMLTELILDIVIATVREMADNIVAHV